MHLSVEMYCQRVFPYDINNDLTDDTDDASSAWATTPMRRIQLDQGKVATVVSGADGNRQALIGALELLECATSNSMKVQDFISWCDEYLVKPGYMNRPTRAFESGVGTIYLATSMVKHQGQDATLRRILTAVRKKVAAILCGLLNDPPDERFLTFLLTTGRVYNIELKHQRVWRIRGRPDDRLRDIVMSLFAADILTNRRIYDQRLSVCNECGRISFRIEMNNRKRCSLHAPTPLEKTNGGG
jgi:hypothetical protein